MDILRRSRRVALGRTKALSRSATTTEKLSSSILAGSCQRNFHTLRNQKETPANAPFEFTPRAAIIEFKPMRLGVWKGMANVSKHLDSEWCEFQHFQRSTRLEVDNGLEYRKVVLAACCKQLNRQFDLMNDTRAEKLAELAATAAYVKAGREFEMLDLQSLTSRYLIAAETAIAAPNLNTIRLIDDLAAEFDLRGLVAPQWVFTGHKMQLAELRQRAIATAREEFESLMRQRLNPHSD